MAYTNFFQQSFGNPHLNTFQIYSHRHKTTLIVVNGGYGVLAVHVSTGRLIPSRRVLATPHLGPFYGYLAPCAERGTFGELQKTVGPNIS